ncbi:helix-turn-helix domain-containing protein [Streptomyces hokutonensis]|uniref:helix-turn-helix domain-containing protein n=1 Tax=Streptomyces hokutonensis TaxID=1306990 RepID=UPI0033FB7A6B
MSQLAAALRELRAATGLSMAGLAAKTTYSKSSWERYLNGRTLPPREAVEELCRLAGEPVGRCLALWEIAESEASGRGASAPTTTAPTAPAPATPTSVSRPRLGKREGRATPTANSTPPAGQRAGKATPTATSTPPAGKRAGRTTPTATSTPPAGKRAGKATPTATSTPPAGQRAGRAASTATSTPPAGKRAGRTTPTTASTPPAGKRGGTDTPPAAAPPSAPGQRGVATLAVVASVCAVAVSAVVLALVLLPGSSKSTPLSPTAASSTATVASGPGCHGADCAGRSPLAMRCAPQPDTITQRETATGAWVELRHSKICGTTWARMWGGRIGDRIELVVPGRAGSTHAAEVGNAVEADTYAYTMMAVTAPGTVVRVCFQPAGTGTGKRECFDGRVT